MCLAKKAYTTAAKLLGDIAKMNLKVEQDFTFSTLITQMDEIAKRITKVKVQCKIKYKYIPPHE